MPSAIRRTMVQEGLWTGVFGLRDSAYDFVPDSCVATLASKEGSVYLTGIILASNPEVKLPKSDAAKAKYYLRVALPTTRYIFNPALTDGKFETITVG